MLEASAGAAGCYALRPDVEIVRRRTTLLLFARGSGRSVRVSPAATDLLPLLTTGADFGALRARLQQAHPKAGDVGTKLAAFLATLESAGIMNGAPNADGGRRPRTARKFDLFNPDPLARALAWPLQKAVPAACGLSLLLMIASIALIALLAYRGSLPRLPDMAEHLHWGGVLLFLLLVVPLHELAHAIACRMTGIEVSGAGIVMHGNLVPGPYVDTSQSYRLGCRWQRFLIPAAGPFVNLTSAGVAAAVLLFADPSEASRFILQGLLFACLLFVYFDTNPFNASDGSHCLEAWLDDELARHYAFSRVKVEAADARVIRRYRIAAFTHLFLSALLFWLWWQ